MNQEATIRLKRHKDDLNYEARPRMDIEDLVANGSAAGTGAWILGIAIIVAGIIMVLTEHLAN